jgi:hypothetical protein
VLRRNKLNHKLEEINRAIVWNYGGGTQSAAIAVMIAQGLLQRPDCVVMSNTTREATETWEYTVEHILPLFEKMGLRLEIVTPDGRLYNKSTDTLPLIPAYTAQGQLKLYCSNTWKRDVVWRYLRRKGYGPKRPIIQWLGLSLDEVHRMKPSGKKWTTNHWPLILDRKTYRGECYQIVVDAGLPPPPKSSCWMCPYRGNLQWQRLNDHYPEDWTKAVELDYAIRARDTQESLYVHRDAVPLDQADLGRNQLSLFDACDSGHCWV